MTVMILHPNDELFFADLQKELIKSLFEEVRIIYSQIPLWIELGDFDIKDKSLIQKVSVGELCVSENCVWCPVVIECNGQKISSKLTLVCLHKGKSFTEKEVAALKEKPARLLKVFRLGLVQNESPHAKSISKSVWCKLHYPASTVE